MHSTVQKTPHERRAEAASQADVRAIARRAAASPIIRNGELVEYVDLSKLESTGDWATDNRIGADYARDVLLAGNVQLAVTIVKGMSGEGEKRNGYEVGFLHHMALQAVRGQGGQPH